MTGETVSASVTAILAAACLGFLPFNFNPAKIFMGDTGSMFLGFLLATVSIQGLFKMYAVVSFAIPFVVLAVPIADIVFSVVRRVAKGKSPFAADRGHWHHRLIDRGWGQRRACRWLSLMCAALGAIGVLLAREDVKEILGGKEVAKLIFVPGRLCNIIVK